MIIASHDSVAGLPLQAVCHWSAHLLWTRQQLLGYVVYLSCADGFGEDFQYPIPSEHDFPYVTTINGGYIHLYTSIYPILRPTQIGYIYIYIVVYGSHGIMWYPQSYPMSLIFMVKSRIAAIFSHRTQARDLGARLTASMWQPNAQRVTSEKLRRRDWAGSFWGVSEIVAFSKIGIFHGNMTKIEGF